jgi:tetratricopeptide (TPR) repeat protein
VQDDITKEIVTALEVKLTLGEQARLWRRHAHSMEAYEDYLRGLECYNRFTKASNRQARLYFESAIARSPDFAAAYHYLGWVHMTDGWFAWSPDRETSLSLAIEHADRAIRLDDTLADGYAVRAFVHTLRGDHDRAAVEAEHAVAINPGGATVCHMLALVRLFAGDPEEAASLERQALRLSPLAQDNFLVALGEAYCLSGRYADAVEVLEQVFQTKPYWLTARTLLAWAYNELGRGEIKCHVTEICVSIPVRSRLGVDPPIATGGSTPSPGRTASGRPS